VRGVLKPVLDKYGVGFRVLHGFGGATTVHEVAAEQHDGRQLVVLYVGDYDPSGMCMSERYLPERLKRYGGGHVRFRRVALLYEHLAGLPSFPPKPKDPRYQWYIQRYGDQAWELDAMDANDLRAAVEAAILAERDPEPWNRCATTEKAEKSLREGC
jgi:hypothetical protein